MLSTGVDEVAVEPLLSGNGARLQPAQFTMSWKQGAQWKGYQATLAYGCCGISAVLLANLTIMIWAVRKNEVVSGVAMVYSGDCSQSESISIVSHFAINLSSTLLFGVSNYCTQCLSSPTRDDLDRAHCSHIGLDIGIRSIRNLRFIKGRRLFLLLVLLASSIPLHWVYNSVVISTTSASYIEPNPDPSLVGTVVPSSCTIGVCVIPLGFVIMCNTFKLICVAICLRQTVDPLATIGDAVASFLGRPDPNTTSSTLSQIRKENSATKQTFYGRVWLRSRFWFSAINPFYWAFALFLMLGSLIIGATLLHLALVEVDNLNSEASDGTTSPSYTLANMGASVVSSILLVNIPQVVFSFVYIFYNDLITSMLLTIEYLSFSVKRQSLRTSSPDGAQRSTKFLSIPYRYGVPLLAAWALMHTLLSQSIYLSLDSTDSNKSSQSLYMSLDSNESNNHDVKIMVSSLWLMCSIIFWGVLILFLICCALGRLPATAMPMPKPCSLAVSIACHPPPGDQDAALFTVQYGIFASGETYDNTEQHVGFSSYKVEPLNDTHGMV